MDRLINASLTLKSRAFDNAASTAFFAAICAVILLLASFSAASPPIKDCLACSAALFGVLFGGASGAAMAIAHSHFRRVLSAKS
jgi:hypothetical protein